MSSTIFLERVLALHDLLDFLAFCIFSHFCICLGSGMHRNLEASDERLSKIPLVLSLLKPHD
jgi:hypothetical protein